DQRRCLLKDQGGPFVHNIKSGRVVGADFSQHNGELRLRFSSSTTTNSGSGTSNNDGSRSSGHAEHFFHFSDQLGQLEHGHAGDSVEDFSFSSHFVELQVCSISRLGIVL